MGNCLSAADRSESTEAVVSNEAKQVHKQPPAVLPEPYKPVVHAVDIKEKSACNLHDDEDLDTSCSNVITNPDTDLILNMLDPENGPAAGLPYQVHYLGPPRPPCENERLATVMALGKIRDQAEPDPEIAIILKLLAGVFKAPAALCALFDKQRVFISEQEGNVIPCGEFPWRWTLCGWSMAFKNPQILVIPDTMKDLRFTKNEKVTVFPKVRFYCGAPLVASNGQRLGTLCFADVKPRTFDQASCILVNNMSELVVRQLEKDIALKMKTQDNKELMETYKVLQRAVDCYDHSVALLDTTEKGWKIVYANASWTKQIGLARERLVGALLCDVLESTDGQQLPSAAMLDAVKHARAVAVRLARVKDPNVTRTVSLSFKPAGRTMLDDSCIPVGVPSFLTVNDSQEDMMHRFFFMTIETPTQKRSSHASSLCSPLNILSSLGGYSTDNSSDSTVIQGLELAHLLGKGSFGWVYYGTWYGTPVAVKIIDEDVRKPKHADSQSIPEDGPHMEALMAHELRHPNIVATLKYATHAIPQRRAPELHEYFQSNDDCMSSMIQSGQPKLSDCGVLNTGLATVASTSSCAATDTADVQALALTNGRTSTDDPAVKPNKAWAVIEAPTEGVLAWRDDENDTVADNTNPILDGQAQLNADRVSLHLTSMTASVLGSSNRVGSGVQGGVVSAGSNVITQTWMVMEYCDKGCIQDAIDRGWLRASLDALTSTPNMAAVLATAHEIASAMQYLHAHDIVHGDLSGWNIMLTSSGASAAAGGRGFIAKVADFGLARSMDLQARITTKNYGTITHMPPELLIKGIMSKAVDVYSFGVLLWQLYTASRPWSGLTHAQIIQKVAQQHQRLQWDPQTPAAYRELAEDCMAYDMEVRPTFAVIVERVEAMRAMDDELQAPNRCG